MKITNRYIQLRNNVSQEVGHWSKYAKRVESIFTSEVNLPLEKRHSMGRRGG
jgi:hypothetical protein